MKKLITFLLLLSSLAATVQNERATEVIYGHKDGLAMTMLVYIPTANAKGKAVINIIICNWIGSDDGALSDKIVADIYIKNGYTVFNVIHGSQPRYNITEAVADIKRAVKYILVNAATFKISGNHIGIVGGSCGGHLALMVATTGSDNVIHEKDKIDKTSDKVQAVCAFFPPTDLLNYGTSDYAPASDSALLTNFGVAGVLDFKVWDDANQLYNYANKNQRLQISREMSPIYSVNTDDPPAFLTHGDKDEIVPLQQSETFIAANKKLIIPIEFVKKKAKVMGGKTQLWKNNYLYSFFTNI